MKQPPSILLSYENEKSSNYSLRNDSCKNIVEIIDNLGLTHDKFSIVLALCLTIIDNNTILRNPVAEPEGFIFNDFIRQLENSEYNGVINKDINIQIRHDFFSDCTGYTCFQVIESIYNIMYCAIYNAMKTEYALLEKVHISTRVDTKELKALLESKNQDDKKYGHLISIIREIKSTKFIDLLKNKSNTASCPNEFYNKIYLFANSAITYSMGISKPINFTSLMGYMMEMLYAYILLMLQIYIGNNVYIAFLNDDKKWLDLFHEKYKNITKDFKNFNLAIIIYKALVQYFEHEKRIEKSTLLDNKDYVNALSDQHIALIPYVSHIINNTNLDNNDMYAIHSIYKIHSISDRLKVCGGIAIRNPVYLNIDTNKRFLDIRSIQMYSKKGLLYIIEEVKNIRHTYNDEYAEFIANCIENWAYEAQSVLYKTIGDDYSAVSFYGEYMYTISSQRWIFTDNSIYSMLCAIMANTQYLCYADIYTPFVRSITDTMLLTIINYHIKGPSIDITSYPLNIIIHYISAITAGISLIIEKDVLFCNLPLHTIEPSYIILTLFNIGIISHYRNVHMPMFKYQKTNILPLYHFETYGQLAYDFKRYFVEIVKRANTGVKYLTTDYLNRYKNVVRYLGNAIINNAITSEYVITMLVIVCKDIPFFTSLNITSPYTIKEDIHIFQDIMHHIITYVGERKETAKKDTIIVGDTPPASNYSDKITTFFSFFERQYTVSSPLCVFSKPGTCIDEKIYSLNNKKTISSLEPYLEVIIFITILQRLVIADDYKKQVNANLKSIYDGIIGTPFDNTIGISAHGIIDDIRNAVSFLNTMTQRIFTPDDWFARNAHAIGKEVEERYGAHTTPIHR